MHTCPNPVGGNATAGRSGTPDTLLVALAPVDTPTACTGPFTISVELEAASQVTIDQVNDIDRADLHPREFPASAQLQSPS